MSKNLIAESLNQHFHLKIFLHYSDFWKKIGDLRKKETESTYLDEFFKTYAGALDSV